MISDVRRLQALVQVAERGTITAAAEALGYTPSAVSQQLSALEDQIGVPVLARRGRNVVLTDAGRLLIEHGQDAIAALERAEAAIAELHGEPTGPVRIGSLASAAASIVTTALQTLRAEHPRVEPELVVHPLDRNIEELRLGSIDVAVEQRYDRAPHTLFDGFEVTELLHEPMVLLSSASSPVTSVEAARDLDWVASPANSVCGSETRRIAAVYGFSPRCRYEMDEQSATFQLVRAGLAVTLAPSLWMVNRPGDIHAVVVPDSGRTICALTRRASTTRPAIGATIEHLSAAATSFVFESLAA